MLEHSVKAKTCHVAILTLLSRKNVSFLKYMQVCEFCPIMFHAARVSKQTRIKLNSF